MSEAEPTPPASSVTTLLDDWSIEIDADHVNLGQDGLGVFDWSEEADNAPVALALMATSSTDSSNSKVSNENRVIRGLCFKTHEKNEYAWGDKIQLFGSQYWNDEPIATFKGRIACKVWTLKEDLMLFLRGGSWDEYLCLVEFAYNNSWHASFKAAPFELLYGRKCRAPICWDEVGERLIEGPELIEITNEKVVVAKEKLKGARSRQKDYADKHRRDLEFQVGDRVLKVSPFRGVKRFGIKGKSGSIIGSVFWRFWKDWRGDNHYHPLHVASYPFDQIQPDMSLSEEPESILDRQERVMRNKVIPFVKILWKNHPEREATWETEESMRASYPHFFV
ncbi:putative nucleotidyltransferase, ribonuclease H [Tanacetum coccineum]